MLLIVDEAQNITDGALVYGFADNLDRIDAARVEKGIKNKICMSGETVSIM